MYLIMKALNGFLMIQRQMTLKVYDTRKLHRPRTISDGFVADSVDTTLAGLYISATGAVSVNCTIS